jgi:MFS family permease
MAGKLLLAVVADRIDRVSLLIAIFLVIAALNVALVASASYIPLVVSAAILGLVLGALTPVFYALLADQFGVASFGTVRGLAAPIVAIASAIAVRFAGEVFDRTGNYDVMFYAFIAIQLIAAAFMLATRVLGRPSLAANSLRPAGAGGRP